LQFLAAVGRRHDRVDYVRGKRLFAQFGPLPKRHFGNSARL